MASNISTTNIDETYPVAGQDNDSQGFRDNFSQIKTQLGTASTEITTIQTNQAVTNADTDFNGHDQSELVLKDWGQKIVAKGTSTHTVTLTGVSFPNDPDGDVGDSSTVSTEFALRKSTFVFDIFSVDGGTTKYISNILEYPSST